MKQGRQARFQAGFTLLELLVVLTMVAFITTLLIQGMGYIAKVNDSFVREGDSRQARELAFGWFDDALTQLVAPEHNDVAGRFRGDALSFEGVTLASVDRREGIPVPFAFRLEPKPGGTELIYVRRIEARRWPLISLAAEAHFEFQDATGQWHKEWPPAPTEADLLPAAVALAETGGGLFLMATVQTPRQQVYISDF
ncbi:type II secretion system protein GspJ [Pseudomonas sp. GD04087]|uniref:prepilin-type N-terminal cleavage/methylation domain-containing protein n=1 Tax=unclassified Pseudomonas TaxID=196821 RepID=UPI00244757BA|nr:MULTISPECIES: prepilin-type N-terminal cleavage/methylation domain-containing protein [unclassified Pseudomonas]MDH0287782.1 type II secretion system protein GspJ [Pseudomonas sp. GD04087]MDH1050793.1 type II secretion system protein GspJ [Pseudomonas sp. GD03903]MDH2002775.1 type II secretion system protein GspJ [Pseudomonas sp. GD03691]